MMLTVYPAPYHWVLPGLPRGRVGILAAPGGTGKSFLSLQWALSLAGGWSAPWPAELLPPRDPQHVIIVTAEETALDVHHRLWAMGQRLTQDEVTTVAAHLHIHPMVGVGLLAGDGPGPLMDALEEALAKRRHALVILDPLARLAEIDENSNTAATHLVNLVDQLARDADAAVIMLHHVGKSAVKAGDGDQSVPRGATGLVDGVRWLATLRPAIPSGAPAAEGMDEVERRRWKVLDLPKLNYSGGTSSITYRQGENGVFTAMEVPEALDGRTVAGTRHRSRAEV